MPDVETPAGPPTPPPEARESLIDFALLAAFFVFPILCVAAAGTAAARVSPWIGVVIAAGGLWSWRRFGPQPSPGFVAGLVCIWGWMAILGVLLACLARAVWRSIA